MSDTTWMQAWPLWAHVNHSDGRCGEIVAHQTENSIIVVRWNGYPTLVGYDQSECEYRLSTPDRPEGFIAAAQKGEAWLRAQDPSTLGPAARTLLGVTLPVLDPEDPPLDSLRKVIAMNVPSSALRSGVEAKVLEALEGCAVVEGKILRLQPLHQSSENRYRLEPT